MKKTMLTVAVLHLAAGNAFADSLVVITNSAGPAVTKEQVADVYLGKSKSLKPLDLPNSAPAKAEFYQKVSGHDLSQVKATWSRLMFTGQGQPPKEMPDAAAVKKAVAADPKAVGYIAKADVDSSVKVAMTLP
jgi:ABC-type phosphate transport system substrate-binding protein